LVFSKKKEKREEKKEKEVTKQSKTKNNLTRNKTEKPSTIISFQKKRNISASNIEGKER
jgi:hypothetical protein